MTAETIEKPKKRRANVKIYTNPNTGEEGTAKYWADKLGMLPESFWRRANDWGDDNPRIFEPISCKGDPKKCNKFSSDVTYRSSATISKETAAMLDEIIKSGDFEFKTDIIRAAVDNFQLTPDKTKSVIIRKGQGKKNKTKDGESLIIKLNDEQSDILDTFMSSRKKYLEYNRSWRITSLSEAIEIILKEYYEQWKTKKRSPKTDTDITEEPIIEEEKTNPLSLAAKGVVRLIKKRA